MPKKELSLREQGKAIYEVALFSVKISPGAVAFKIGGSLLDALLPLLTAYFAALTTTSLVGAFQGDDSAARSAILYVVITSLLGLLMTVWRSLDQYIQAKLRYVVESAVSDRMYEHFLELDFWRYDDKDTADLYDRAQKFAQFFAYVFDRIAGLFSQLLAMILAVIALAIVNVWVSLALFIALLPGVYLQFRLSRLQVAHWNNTVETRRSKNMIEWNLLQPEHITELRIYGLVRHLLNMRKKLRDKDELTRINFERRFLKKRIMADGLEFLLQVASLVWVVLEIAAARLAVGQFVYVNAVVERAINSANGFVRELASLDEDMANLFDYQQFMELPPRTGGKNVLKDTPSVISFENVTFAYQGSAEIRVLENISFDIERNQHIAIVGENGAGKSTLVKLLLGLYDPVQGRVLVDGSPITDIDLASWHRLLGVLQQDFIQYSFATAGDNVKFGDVAKHDQDIKQALTQAEALEFVTKLPKGVDSYVYNWMEDDDGTKGKDLSGGQWQRLALARNFFRNAPIVILDEPTSAIDALAEARIFDRLFKSRQKTVIAISHRLSTIKKADRILMLKDGKLVESGTYKELVGDKDSHFYTMFKSQIDS